MSNQNVVSMSDRRSSTASRSTAKSTTAKTKSVVDHDVETAKPDSKPKAQSSRSSKTTATPRQTQKSGKLISKFKNPDAVPDSDESWEGHFLECGVEDCADDEGELGDDGEYFWEFDLMPEDSQLFDALKGKRTVRIEIDANDALTFTAF